MKCPPPDLRPGEIAYCIRIGENNELWYTSADQALRAFDLWAGTEETEHEPARDALVDNCSLWLRVNGKMQRVR